VVVVREGPNVFNEEKGIEGLVNGPVGGGRPRYFLSSVLTAIATNPLLLIAFIYFIM
jgi:hypothetical protein